MSLRDGDSWQWPALGLATWASLGALAWLDHAFGWFEPAFRLFTRLFYEQSVLAEIRWPSQLPLARAHLAIWVGMVALGLIASGRLGRHGRLCWGIFCVGYAIRAIFWVAGGNIPLVPGDSCHYVEVATSVYRGEGPVKHYVESFFRDYPAIRAGQGVLDDWATPLWAYVLAGVYRVLGVTPGDDLTATFAVAKGVSFTLNLLTLPALYLFVRRHYGPGVALGALAILAVLPVHALYAGFGLRESAVALTSVLAAWFLVETVASEGWVGWVWAIAAGLAGGSAILARNTGMAFLAAIGLAALVGHGRRRLGSLLLWGFVVLVVIAPWAWETWRVYGEPFYTYTKYFQYNFSWAIHHYQAGNTRPEQFYNLANLPEILRVKFRALLIIGFYSLMILSLPIALGFLHRWRSREARKESRASSRDIDRMAAFAFVIFALATLSQIADITQVQQLARYYLPVYLLMIPTAAAGLRDWLSASLDRAKWSRVFAVMACLLWADPSWSYDASWLTKPYQLHWPAIREAGDWVRSNPSEVPVDARIMTWFPWELRVTSDRTTILFPRALEAGAFEFQRIQETIQQYGVTHILWGSFEPAPNQDPERLGPYLESLRKSLGLTEERLLYQTDARRPYPVRLYRLDGVRP